VVEGTWIIRGPHYRSRVTADWPARECALLAGRVHADEHAKQPRFVGAAERPRLDRASEQPRFDAALLHLDLHEVVTRRVLATAANAGAACATETIDDVVEAPHVRCAARCGSGRGRRLGVVGERALEVGAPVARGRSEYVQRRE
jgi:hypothetical protein